MELSFILLKLDLVAIDFLFAKKIGPSDIFMLWYFAAYKLTPEYIKEAKLRGDLDE